MITTAEFWKGALERLVKTFLQAFVAALGVAVGSDIAGVGLTDLNWLGALNIAGVAAFLSLCTSIGNASFTAGQPSTTLRGANADFDEGRRVEL